MNFFKKENIGLKWINLEIISCLMSSGTQVYSLLSSSKIKWRFCFGFLIKDQFTVPTHIQFPRVSAQMYHFSMRELWNKNYSIKV